MQPSEIALIFDHLYWIRDRILDTAAGPGVAWPGKAPAGLLDLRATLVHELDVEWSWRERLRNADFPEGELVPDDYPTCATLSEHWQRDEVEMRTWIAGLTDEQLALPPPGATKPFPLSFYVLHISTHAQQQFSDAAVLLTRAGHSPGEIEFLEFADPRPPSA